MSHSVIYLFTILIDRLIIFLILTIIHRNKLSIHVEKEDLILFFV